MKCPEEMEQTLLKIIEGALLKLLAAAIHEGRTDQGAAVGNLSCRSRLVPDQRLPPPLFWLSWEGSSLPDNPKARGKVP